jgi:RsmE family RNA methyltransferase
MNLILLAPSEIVGDGAVCLEDQRAVHLRKVLKVKAGDTVRAGILDGPVGTATVEALDGNRVQLRCTMQIEVPARPSVDLLLAVPRPKVMRRLWAQVAALGVGQVILTNAEKVERDYFDSHVLHEDGYRPLLIEGLQQARDTRVPLVSIHKRFRVLIEDDLDRLCPGARRVVAHPEAGEGAACSVSAVLADVEDDERVLLAVGPEGGWNEFELELLEAHRFQRIGLGPRTLTTTTACIALLALVHEAIRRTSRHA